MTWQGIQFLIRDTFASMDDDNFMEGYLAIPHTIYSNNVVERDEERSQQQPALQVDMDDWWILYKEINVLPNQANQTMSLNMNKMNIMAATVDIDLD